MSSKIEGPIIVKTKLPYCQKFDTYWPHIFCIKINFHTFSRLNAVEISFSKMKEIEPIIISKLDMLITLIMKSKLDLFVITKISRTPT